MVYQWDSFFPQLSTYGEKSPWIAGANDPSSVFETGSTLFNTVALDGANEHGSFKLGYSNMKQSGIMPNSSVIRDNVDFAASYKLTDKLTVTANANYIKTKGKGRFGTGYDSQNFMQTSKQVVKAAINFETPDRLPIIFDSFNVSDTHGVGWKQIGTGDHSLQHTIDEWGCGWERSEVENMGIVTGHPLIAWNNLETYTFLDPDDPTL